MYNNYTKQMIREAESDAELFSSVGLTWLAGVCARKANRLKASEKAKRRARIMENRTHA